MESKKEYTAPELTVVTFKVEQGFNGSSVALAIPNFFDIAGLATQQSWETLDETTFGTTW